MRQKPGLGFVNSKAVLNFPAAARVTSFTEHSIFSLVRTFRSVTTWPWSSEVPISTSAPWAFTMMVWVSSLKGDLLASVPSTTIRT